MAHVVLLIVPMYLAAIDTSFEVRCSVCSCAIHIRKTVGWQWSKAQSLVERKSIIDGSRGDVLARTRKQPFVNSDAMGMFYIASSITLDMSDQ